MQLWTLLLKQPLLETEDKKKKDSIPHKELVGFSVYFKVKDTKLRSLKGAVKNKTKKKHTKNP